jgi:hypothetical protein
MVGCGSFTHVGSKQIILAVDFRRNDLSQVLATLDPMATVIRPGVQTA